MTGRTCGTLAVLRRVTRDLTPVVWQRSGNQGNAWQEVNINLLLYADIEVRTDALHALEYRPKWLSHT